MVSESIATPIILPPSSPISTITMSWLARSIANTLLIHDDDDDYPHPSSSNPNHHHHPSQSEKGRHDFSDEEEEEEEVKGSEIEDEDRTGGVKEDLSEFTESLTRQLWGVASFLAPPPASPSFPLRKLKSQIDPYDDDHHHASSNSSAYDHGISDSLSYHIEKAVGVTEEVLAFARNISHHPETWLDFPLSEEEDHDDFEMSDTQWNHVSLVERVAPRLGALRVELCPILMSESYFWKVYFVLLHPRLNKHDADLLSTPQMVAARSMWIKELQNSETSTCHVFDGHQDHHHIHTQEFPLNNPITHESVTQTEEGSTQTPSTSSCSYTEPPIEEDDDEDDWVHENSGYIGPDFHIGTDEDISFSDLEADDEDCTMPIKSKIM